MTERKDFPVDAEEARLDRDLTREELTETLDALGHKLDVKSRLGERVDAKLAQAATKVADVISVPAAEKFRRGTDAVRNNPLPVSVGAIVLVLLLRLFIRRKRPTN